jgi:hypothetical protein
MRPLTMYRAVLAAALVALTLSGYSIAQDVPESPTPDRALSFYVLDQPLRLLDTRVVDPCPVRPCGLPIQDGEARYIQAQLNASIPPGARAVVVTLTAVDATSNGRLVLYNPQAGLPAVTSLSFGPGLASSAGATSALGVLPHPDLAVWARVSGGGTVHVIIDVVGYFQ